MLSKLSKIIQAYICEHCASHMVRSILALFIIVIINIIGIIFIYLVPTIFFFFSASKEMKVSSSKCHIFKRCTNKNVLTGENNGMDTGNKNGRNGDLKCQVEPESFQLEKQAFRTSLRRIQDWPFKDSPSTHVHLRARGPKSKHLPMKVNL